MRTLLLNLLIDAILIGIPAFYFYKFGKAKTLKKILKEFGLFFRSGRKDAISSALIFIELFAASIAISLALSAFGLNDLGNVTNAIETVKKTAPLLLIYIFLVRIPAEELFFRSFLTKRLGIWLSSAIFALAHVSYYSTGEVIGAFILGAILAHNFRANRTIVPNIIAHILYNFIIIILVLV
ncbi:MAG: CPBP family intramembrane metalloprotease [Candidatus Diapherotrites archaeon]|nr:CPBP family intramembrane metalloprotease [Candidatus Diapherotrites archaeon]